MKASCKEVQTKKECVIMNKMNMALSDDDLGIVTGGANFTNRPPRALASPMGGQDAGADDLVNSGAGSQMSGIVARATREGGKLSAGEGMVV